MKNTVINYENTPKISYDDNEYGWKSIYLGILSPYKNKYKKYI